MHAFWLSLVMIFIAELGDKTQLVALALATCYNSRVVLSGIFWATLAVHVFSAGIGWLMGGMLPTDWITFVAGISFIAFGFWTLRGDSLEEDEKVECKTGVNAFWLVFSTFFMAELGDKTMLSTISLATTNPFLPVWLGSTVGMVISDGLAVVVGKMLGKNLPEKAIGYGASIIFFAFGAWNMYEGGIHFSPLIWAAAVTVILLTGFFFLRKPSAFSDGQGN
ncbi:MAG: TMEM165/GDT1 family protein [Chlorobiaceae bacterium]|nr:TMEM165/GDT1 family protein [Chlorobiaceae bacterium]NTW74556.1 TMEM165/GDT1 family protein [Chlorobiaceae bacterium]